MGVILKEEINMLIENMKKNNINKLNFIKGYYTCYINAFKNYFEIIIMQGDEVKEQYKIHFREIDKVQLYEKYRDLDWDTKQDDTTIVMKSKFRGYKLYLACDNIKYDYNRHYYIKDINNGEYLWEYENKKLWSADEARIALFKMVYKELTGCV